jgi:hypothetical protein
MWPASNLSRKLFKKRRCVTMVSYNYNKPHKTTLVGWVDKVFTKKNIMLGFTFTWI